LFIIIISSYLLISSLEMPSFKFKGILFVRNKFKDLFVITSIGLIIGFKLAAFPIIIIIYILLSLFRIKF